ncbi:hypothetical protein MN116_008736 [Schistosoma mekongi]|uniref:Peptidase M14 domain-containing protein n=1 Tax=Schistosoma mekongi TaxID=38744 RepID=A0AAE1Z570_SCHME|nr:hypothetical protein MN116_008736 [Schistosoma mekongi]
MCLDLIVDLAWTETGQSLLSYVHPKRIVSMKLQYTSVVVSWILTGKSYEILQSYNKCFSTSLTTSTSSSSSSSTTTITTTTTSSTTTSYSTSVNRNNISQQCRKQKQQISINNSIFNKLYITYCKPVIKQDNNSLNILNKYNNSMKSTIRIKKKNIKSYIKLKHTNNASIKKTKLFSNKLSKIINSDSKHYYNKSLAGLNTYSQPNDTSISPCLHSTSFKHIDSPLFPSQSCIELTNIKSVNNFNRIHKQNALENRIDVVRLNRQRRQRQQQQDSNSSVQRKLSIHFKESTLHYLPNSSSTSLSIPRISNIIERNAVNDNGDSDNNQDESGEDDIDKQVEEDGNDDEEDDDENCDDEDNVDIISDNDVSNVNQHTFDELITSHLKFFPEWFDLPNEIPNRLIKEQIIKPVDMDSVNWPYELNTTNKRSNNPLTQSTIDEYLYFTTNIHSLLPFHIISYPDLMNSNEFFNEIEPFYATNEFIQGYFNQYVNTVNTPLNSCSYNEKLFEVESTIHNLIDDDDDDNNNNKTKKSIHLSGYHVLEVKLFMSINSVQHSFNTYKPIELSKILDDIRRFIDSSDVVNRVVFDLDELLLNELKEQYDNNVYNSSKMLSLKQQFHNLQHSSNVNLKCSIKEFIDNIPITSSIMHSSYQITSSFNKMNDYIEFKSLFNTTQSTNSNHLQDNLHSSLYSSLKNNCRLLHNDELMINQLDTEKGHLDFESRFECGNLRKVIQVRQYEYDLILNPDVNTTSNIQWFYFRVSNMEANISYRFNIINCEKNDSQFNAGMQPLLFSVREALDSRPYWRRVGSNIIYYKNHFIRQMTSKNNMDCEMYYTATFTICFPYTGDICYLAYHYPYTYTHLLIDLNKWQNQTLNNSNNLYFRIQQLTSTILSNPMPVITITEILNKSDKYINNNQRPYIMLTCRVHPGESNSSWIMKGLLEKLLSTDDIKIVELRKIHRCSISGKDLNRHWINPSPLIHPTIYHSKMLLQLLAICERSPYIFIDFHGHSRMKNIFLYGCSSNESWLRPDVQNPTYRDGEHSEDISYRTLPKLLYRLSPYFSKQSCLYMISKAKESTARIAVWRQFNVLRSYTIEASYCGIYNTWRGEQLVTSQKQQQHQQEGNSEVEMEQQKVNEPIIIQHQIRPTDLMEFGSHLLNAFTLLTKEETVAISSINNTVSPLSSSTYSSTTTISNRSFTELVSPISPNLNIDTKRIFNFDDVDDISDDDGDGDDDDDDGNDENVSDGDKNEEVDVEVNVNNTNVDDETLRVTTL